MKRIISLIITLCLVLSSFSFAFASATSWDTSDQTNLSNAAGRLTYSGYSAARLLYDISQTLTTMNTRVLNIYNALFQGNHSIAYWVEAINSWMSPIYGRLADIITNTLNIEAVAGLLGSTDIVDGTTVRTPYLSYNSKGVAQWVSEIQDYFLLKSYPTYYRNNPTTQIALPRWTGTGTTSFTFTPANTPILGALHYDFSTLNANLVDGLRTAQLGTFTSQTYMDWSTLQTGSFTPASTIDGIYKWFSNIQNPVARLSYVLASDERIEAQEAAAANEEAVVDNFIDSSGTGSVGVSDFGSLSDASGAMKSNFDTGQSAAGVFNVFDDSHFIYLSQSAADQLDTTGSNNKNRLLKSSGSDYDTPALDRYYEELNKILEVNKDD